MKNVQIIRTLYLGKGPIQLFWTTRWQHTLTCYICEATGVPILDQFNRLVWSLVLVWGGRQGHRRRTGSSRGWAWQRISGGLGTERTRFWRSGGSTGNEDLFTVFVQSLSTTVMLGTLTLPDEIRWRNSHHLQSCIKHNIINQRWNA